MDALAELVLSMIRTNAELVGDAANRHGLRMNQAVDVLEQWPATDPLQKYLVATEALNYAVDVQGRCNDLDGPIGRAVVRLLRLHPQLAAQAGIAPSALVDWLIVFQFYARHRCLFMNPVDYLPILGRGGVAMYEESLREVELMLPPRPSPVDSADLATLVDWHTLDRQFQYVSEMRRKLGAQPPAARTSAQCAYDAARRWWLLACEFHPGEIATARLAMFRMRPSFDEAAALYEASTPQQWEGYRFEVMAVLEDSPTDAVRFVLDVLQDVSYAWDLAHLLSLDLDEPLWEALTTAYQQHRRSA